MFRILAFAGVAIVAALILPSARAVDFVGGFGLALFGPMLLAVVGAAIVGAVGLISVAVADVYRTFKTRESATVAAIACVAAACAAAILIGVGPAVAAQTAAPTSANVTIPWGDWLSQLLLASGSVFAAVASWVVGRFAPAAVKTFLTNDVIEKAVDYAIATTKDAARGQSVSIQVSNQLIAAALVWVVDNEPKLANAAYDRLRPLIVARLSALGQIPAEATASTLAVASPAPSA